MKLIETTGRDMDGVGSYDADMKGSDSHFRKRHIAPVRSDPVSTCPSAIGDGRERERALPVF